MGWFNLAGPGRKGLRKKDGQIGPVYPFSPRCSVPNWQVNHLPLDRVKIIVKGAVLASKRKRVKEERWSDSMVQLILCHPEALP